MMDTPNTSTGRRVLRLTPEELKSQHVDNLLTRQMSLRGDTNISRGPKRWYLRNWFVFMIVGALAALAAWAIVEPYFDDTLYIQGQIQDMNLTDVLPESFIIGNEYYEVPAGGRGWIQIQDQPVWLLNGISDLNQRKISTADLSVLKAGSEVGIYVERMGTGTIEDVNLGRFLVLSPDPDPPAKAGLSLERQQARTSASGLLLFSLVAGMIGLFIGAVDGIICRTFRRAVLSGLVGLLQ
jgi:hypothetical protein